MWTCVFWGMFLGVELNFYFPTNTNIYLAYIDTATFQGSRSRNETGLKRRTWNASFSFPGPKFPELFKQQLL